MLTKVCGMRDAGNIRMVDDLRPDFMGFIFHEASPRCVHEVPEYLPVHAARTGVFVDKDFDFIMDRKEAFALTWIQLHGHETPELCARLRENGLKVLKAFSISGKEDLSGVSEYAGCCDCFIFDTKCSGSGGSGRSFDWKILDGYSEKVPFLIGGGIGPDTDLAAFHHPMLAGFDLNSRFEVSPGMKDIDSLEKTIRKIRTL